MKQFLIIFMLVTFALFVSGATLVTPKKSGVNTTDNVTFEQTVTAEEFIATGAPPCLTFQSTGEMVCGPTDGLIVFDSDGSGAYNNDIVFELELSQKPIIYSTSSDTFWFQDEIIIRPDIYTNISPTDDVVPLTATIRYDPIGGDNGTIVAVGGGVLPQSDNDTITTTIIGMRPAHEVLTSSFGGPGSAGGTGYEVIGVNAVAAKSTALASDATFTGNNFIGLKVGSLTVNATFPGLYSVNTGVWSAYIEEAETTFGAKPQTLLEIVKPTNGNPNYQVVLQGLGDGTGIWFGGTTSGCRVYSIIASTGCNPDTEIVAGGTNDLCGVCP